MRLDTRTYLINRFQVLQSAPDRRTGRHGSNRQAVDRARTVLRTKDASGWAWPALA